MTGALGAARNIGEHHFNNRVPLLRRKRQVESSLEPNVDVGHPLRRRPQAEQTNARRDLHVIRLAEASGAVAERIAPISALVASAVVHVADHKCMP